jgi:hypothetical protein
LLNQSILEKILDLEQDGLLKTSKKESTAADQNIGDWLDDVIID